MNAKELMIGNYIGYNSNKSYYINQIKTINTNSVTFQNGIVIKYKNLIPIPLTEKWLVDFGFEIIESGYIKSDIFNPLYIDNDLKLWLGDNFYIEIEYVHILQNWYNLLTGKQLTK